ncbi:S9 family peptidase [Rivibacter subsaxonicus]|uniref:Dipeptidyl aminopeptidase/acylaminoacyl peptidase n=1 Tax=Rivibacter subsaxonicus TaxID=457575 RepID=A0A4Q7VXL8_9BURK|nr:prolyl oligopeptidase family serine peptidase [Rivibacter subsaxonicus]RZU01129.1 dipeptidyl aminopeptidase/acylaminoacyl peptidase [Rivibacter subsaxonicus]
MQTNRPAGALWSRLVAGGLAVLALLCTSAQAAPPSIDDFFKAPTFAQAALSPSGRYLAVGVGLATGRVGLGVIDLEQRNAAPKLVANFSDADIGYFQWLNDRRLIYTAAENDKAAANLSGARGLWAIDRDGADGRKLIERRTYGVSDQSSHIVSKVLPSSYAIEAVPSDGSDDVIVAEARRDNVGDFVGSVPFRLDTRSGVKRILGPVPDTRITYWVFDSRGDARVAVAQSGGKARLYWRETGNDKWTLLDEYESRLSQKLTPLWVDGNELYVTAGAGAASTRSLFRYDVPTRKIVPGPVFTIAGFDYGRDYQVDHGSGRVIAIHYATDAAGTHWFDPQLKAAQQEVDKLLPTTVNRIICTRCTDAPRLLVRAHSDRQPALYLLFDTQTRKLEYVGGARPWIDAKQMATQDFVRIKARDGMSLPIYITKPAGKSTQPQPAVVLVHGGPHVRGNVWGWDADAQFLASRGYIVIEPEFRGGDGFGLRHLEAGFKQWGLAMQDDVTDATHWAIKEAGVDPKRICIAGASYGGYAALMGLVREPDLYRCGINWVGVTDPEFMFSLHWSDFSEEAKRYGLPVMLGDPKADAARFAATSPLKQADKINQPLLLAYGGVDRRVPIKHGTAFRDAVIRHNKDVEWVAYGDEGHGWGSMENKRDFWGRVEKFLARNIGEVAPAVASK